MFYWNVIWNAARSASITKRSRKVNCVDPPLLRYAEMENLLQKFCLTLVGVFSIMNFSTYAQRSARNSAYVHGMIAHCISTCS